MGAVSGDKLQAQEAGHRVDTVSGDKLQAQRKPDTEWSKNHSISRNHQVTASTRVLLLLSAPREDSLDFHHHRLGGHGGSSELLQVVLRALHDGICHCCFWDDRWTILLPVFILHVTGHAAESAGAGRAGSHGASLLTSTLVDTEC
eukprot:1150897-Pelagomonas_calceolata.AAC.6